MSMDDNKEVQKFIRLFLKLPQSLHHQDGFPGFLTMTQNPEIIYICIDTDIYIYIYIYMYLYMYRYTYIYI